MADIELINAGAGGGDAGGGDAGGGDAGGGGRDGGGRDGGGRRRRRRAAGVLEVCPTREYAILNVAGLRPWVCAECGAGFRTENALKHHVDSVYRQVKFPVPCRRCPNRFESAGALADHLRRG